MGVEGVFKSSVSFKVMVPGLVVVVDFLSQGIGSAKENPITKNRWWEIDKEREQDDYTKNPAMNQCARIVRHM